MDEFTLADAPEAKVLLLPFTLIKKEDFQGLLPRLSFTFWSSKRPYLLVHSPMSYLSSKQAKWVDLELAIYCDQKIFARSFILLNVRCIFDLKEVLGGAQLYRIWYQTSWLQLSYDIHYMTNYKNNFVVLSLFLFDIERLI